MKSLLVFLRIIIVGILWGIVFTEGLRVIMLCNWHFDIFWPDHWRYFIDLWKKGWVVKAPKEWALVLLIITYIPMLLTGWWTLSLVAWEDIIWKIITLPYTLYCKLIKSPINAISTGNHYGVVKRKSYKQIRPAGINTLRVPISDYGDNSASATVSSIPPAYSGYSASSSYSSNRVANNPKKTDVAATIDHALFKFDDDDDDFDLDIDSFEKTDLKKKPKEEPKKTLPRFDFDDDDEEEDEIPAASKHKEFDFDDDDDDDEFEEVKPRANSRHSNKRGEEKEKRSSKQDKNESSRSEKKRGSRRNENNDTEESPAKASHGPVFDALQQKNYNIISNITIGNTLIDFIGVSENNICLCLVDKESGDWLADEEMFNGEDPLWFSENSHRVSPVCLLSNASKIIKERLDDEGFEQNIESYVVIQMANIINADDMFETWNDMDINVTRINRGAPKEIRLFSKTLPEAESKISKKEFDKICKVFKNLK